MRREGTYLKGIVYVLHEGLQFYIEKLPNPMEIKGRQQDISNELESWERFRDNLNEKSVEVELKIIWKSYKLDVLNFCQQVFPDLAGLQVEFFDDIFWRVHYSSGKKCIILGPACFVLDGMVVRQILTDDKSEAYKPTFEECFSTAASCHFLADKLNQMEKDKVYLRNKLKKMQVILKRRDL